MVRRTAFHAPSRKPFSKESGRVSDRCWRSLHKREVFTAIHAHQHRSTFRCLHCGAAALCHRVCGPISLSNCPATANANQRRAGGGVRAGRDSHCHALSVVYALDHHRRGLSVGVVSLHQICRRRDGNSNVYCHLRGSILGPGFVALRPLTTTTTRLVLAGAKQVPQPVRRIKYYDANTQKTFNFLTTLLFSRRVRYRFDCSSNGCNIYDREPPDGDSSLRSD